MKPAALLFLASGISASYAPSNDKYEPETPYPHHTPHYEPAYPSPPPRTKFTPPTIPEDEEPYPFMKFPKDEKEKRLEIPSFTDYHCFLTGAPWTQCGRRSLTSYFLDQCMAFHWLMTKNVDGICGGKPPSTPPPQYEYNKYKPAPSPTAKEYEGTGTGYSRAITDEYLKEKCLQKAFISITTATVQCLTENSIRIKYIEHYAKDASINPVEGPTLYLKKMHEFIREVISCTSSTNDHLKFPTLYKTSTNYNPNSPFYLLDGKVSLYQYTNGKAAGIESYTVGDSTSAKKFLCSNAKHLEQINLPGSPMKWKYNTLPHKHYPDYTQACSTSTAFTRLELVDTVDNILIRTCSSLTDGAAQSDVFSVNGVGKQFVTKDMSLRSFYDAVHPYEEDTTAIRRPKTIAEIAVSGAGMIEQPILEGFGIMYYCAFYACKANNGGNMEGTCFPTFEDDDEYELSPLRESFADIKEVSNEVSECLADHWLSSKDVADNNDVELFKIALKRSYICMTENSVVEFLDEIIPNWQTADDAVSLVYGRHLADEKCYEEQKTGCASNNDLYTLLKKALKALHGICETHKVAYKQDMYQKHIKNIYQKHYQYNGYPSKGNGY